jgi:mRNA (2'-O-methyladenosine-N6-)-methyltransferase
MEGGACPHVHFQPIIRPYTDTSLGHCSYLNMCYGEPLFSGNPSLGDTGSGSKFGTKECR